MAKPIEQLTPPIYRVPFTQPKRPEYSTTACDVCDQWEATVQFKRTKLCDECASEEGIKIL